MPKTTRIERIYVEVDLDDYVVNRVHADSRGEIGGKWHKDLLSTADDVAKAIRRHVDSLGGVRVQAEKSEECEYCGAQWTEGDADFNGGCCDKDMEHEPASMDDAARGVR